MGYGLQPDEGLPGQALRGVTGLTSNRISTRYRHWPPPFIAGCFPVYVAADWSLEVHLNSTGF